MSVYNALRINDCAGWRLFRAAKRKIQIDDKAICVDPADTSQLPVDMGPFEGTCP